MRTAGWRYRALLVLVIVYSLFPIYFITVQSLKTPQEDVFGSPLWIRQPSFENYAELFAGADAPVRGFVIVPRVPFIRWVQNSLVVLLGSLALTLGCAVAAAYALGRLQPPGWRWWRRLLLASYVVPQTLLFIPLYRIVVALDLDDSLTALTAIYAAMALPF